MDTRDKPGNLAISQVDRAKRVYPSCLSSPQARGFEPSLAQAPSNDGKSGLKDGCRMRWLGIANFHGLFSRIGLAIAAASLLFASVVHAAEMKDLTQNMPRGYFGEFRWDGDSTLQNVVVTFDSVRALNGHKAEALGCGTYEVGRQVTKIKVRMLVRLSDLQVEIFELSPEGNVPFVTGGKPSRKAIERFSENRCSVDHNSQRAERSAAPACGFIPHLCARSLDLIQFGVASPIMGEKGANATPSPPPSASICRADAASPACRSACAAVRLRSRCFWGI